MNKKILTISLILTLNTSNFIKSMEIITPKSNPLLFKEYLKLELNKKSTINTYTYNNKNEIQATLLQIINIMCNPEREKDLKIILDPELIRKIVEANDKENADLYELIIQEHKKRKNKKKRLVAKESDIEILSVEEILEDLNNKIKNN
ncbi:MAG: hypothetical protein UR12_C0001G0016 [candidate division TM6 bacterium GW2011_GWF2_30_66]|nr:MAG: hypothetical protein UR12_C0001G0016 [candidate division TM6 bacterium GW2011_GWF2_30_66]